MYSKSTGNDSALGRNAAQLLLSIQSHRPILFAAIGRAFHHESTRSIRHRLEINWDSSGNGSKCSRRLVLMNVLFVKCNNSILIEYILVRNLQIVRK
jgi:hypothetical protein